MYKHVTVTAEYCCWVNLKYPGCYLCRAVKESNVVALKENKILEK